MLSFDQTTAIKFKGNAEEQKLSSDLFGILRAHGRFMSADAPIRVSLESLKTFFEQTGEGGDGRVERLIEQNPKVFTLIEADGEKYVETTRSGRAPVEVSLDLSHSFDRRFMT